MKKLKHLFWIPVICAAFGMLVAGCSRNTQGASVQLKGSDTMVNLGQRWSEGFMKKNPGVNVAVTGGGSGTGIAALIGKSCDIAMASRAMKPEEIQQGKKNGVNPTEIEVARDALVVVVNPANPVKKLTFAQLSGIFTGKITNWQEVGGNNQRIVVLSREKNSGTHVYFLEHVIRMGNEKGSEQYAPTVLMMPSSQAIADEVATNKAAIGYYGLGYLNKQKQAALQVAHDANSSYVAPSVETVVSGTYPISRPLFLYTNGKPAGNVKSLVDYILSSEGQAVVEKEGFVQLKATK